MAASSVAYGIKERPSSYSRAMLPPYTKPHLSFVEQLELLIERGMDVSDEAKAIKHLQRIGYGRLAPYWQPFLQRVVDPGNPRRRIQTNQFRTGAEFRHSVDLYLFDKQLRLLFLDAIERIEVALRVDLAHALGKRDPFAHRSPKFLDPKRATSPFRSSTRHEVWLMKADDALDRSKEEWVRDFHAAYRPPMPIWMAVEAWDFGTLSWLLEMAHPNDRFAIARRYTLLPDTFVSWIRCIAFVRNLSAHHARLWNTGIINQPQVPKTFEAPQAVHIGADIVRRNRVYGASVAAAYLVKQINPATSWARRMKAHWQSFPIMPHAFPTQGGFVANWQTELIWS